MGDFVLPHILVHFMSEYDFTGYGYKDAEIDIEQLRNLHFNNLKNTCYLDHAGTTIPSQIQLSESFNNLSSTLLANPHSASPSSLETTNIITKVRQEVLEWFGTNSQNYSVIFTSGSTASIKLVAESFPFTKESTLRQTVCNHTSCVGMRTYALQNNAKIQIVDNNDEEIIATIQQSDNESSSAGNNLFVYPAESNYSGIKFPLDWIHKYKNKSRTGNWFVMLDASAFISTNELNLEEYPFDFVCFSFHKLFGYPTGLGALLVRNATGGQILQKQYFGGGTVEGVIATEPY